VIQLLMQASKAGESVSLFGLTPHFQKVFTMVGITKYAKIHADEQAASAV
jgi:anti-anti-sigma regulatory factor